MRLQPIAMNVNGHNFTFALDGPDHALDAVRDLTTAINQTVMSLVTTFVQTGYPVPLADYLNVYKYGRVPTVRGHEYEITFIVENDTNIIGLVYPKHMGPSVFDDLRGELLDRGLIDDSASTEHVKSVILALMFGDGPKQPYMRDPANNLMEGCVPNIPRPITKPTQITVERYGLGDAIRRSFLLRDRDSWCSIADDVINHYLPPSQ